VRDGKVKRQRTRWLAASAILLLAAVSASAQIEPKIDLAPPDLLELIGHLGKAYEGETGGWDLQLGVGFTATVYHYHLDHLRVLNSGRLAGQILSAVEPERPNFILSGSSAEVAKLAQATTQEIVRITGWQRIGSRLLMVTEVSVAPRDASTPR
jgi:hypothetical protein